MWSSHPTCRLACNDVMKFGCGFWLTKAANILQYVQHIKGHGCVCTLGCLHPMPLLHRPWSRASMTNMIPFPALMSSTSGFWIFQSWAQSQRSSYIVVLINNAHVHVFKGNFACSIPVIEKCPLSCVMHNSLTSKILENKRSHVTHNIREVYTCHYHNHISK